MKILLTTLNSKYIHTALSLRYLKAYVDKQSDHIVDIKEYTINQHTNYILGDIYRQRFDLIAFSVYIWNANEIYDLVESIKIVSPSTKIVLGGPEVSFDIPSLMRRYSGIDYVVYGEGENPFLDLVEALAKGEELENIGNIAYRDGKDIRVNSSTKKMLKLEDMPEIYDYDLGGYENKIIYYESSRGCPFNCKFCLSSTIRGVRYFDLDRVKRDMEKFLDQRVKQVKFIDRTFNANKEHAMEIMEYIAENDNGYTNFHFEVTAHLLDSEILDFLSRVPVGLFQFEIGVQSTNPKTIAAINRTTDIEKLSEIVRYLKNSENIHLHLDLIAGLPYEDYDSFKRSFNDIYQLKPEKLQLGFLKLLRGSDMRSEEEHGFKYLDKPPYEILENKYISYDQILRLKDIEELVDIYGNEYRFKNSLDYLMNNYYRSPFDFYEEFADYWREKSLYQSSHGKVEQYRILYDFFNSKASDNIDLFKDIIRYDYIGDTKSPNIPVFMRSTDEIDKRERYKLLKSDKLREDLFSDVEEREYNNMHKFVYIDRFIYNIETGKREQTLYLFDYRISERELKKSDILNVTKYWRDMIV